MGVAGVGGKKKQFWRVPSEWAAWYPGLAPQLFAAAGLTIDYEAVVGLHLNLPRIQAQHTVFVAEGMSISQSDEDVSLDLADAIARHPEEAGIILHRINFARMAQRLRNMRT